jgi:hypothetical protein
VVLGFRWLWVDLGFWWLIGMFDVAVCVELRKKGKKKNDGRRENCNSKKLIFK